METNNIQKSIDQIGIMAVARYLPKGMKLQPCDMHGHFLTHYSTKEPLCPLCVTHSDVAEGTTATQVEHYIDLRDAATSPFSSDNHNG